MTSLWGFRKGCSYFSVSFLSLNFVFTPDFSPHDPMSPSVEALSSDCLQSLTHSTATFQVQVTSDHDLVTEMHTQLVSTPPLFFKPWGLNLGPYRFSTSDPPLSYMLSHILACPHFSFFLHVLHTWMEMILLLSTLFQENVFLFHSGEKNKSPFHQVPVVPWHCFHPHSPWLLFLVLFWFCFTLGILLLRACTVLPFHTDMQATCLPSYPSPLALGSYFCFIFFHNSYHWPIQIFKMHLLSASFSFTAYLCWLESEPNHRWACSFYCCWSIAMYGTVNEWSGMVIISLSSCFFEHLQIILWAL